MRNQIPLQESHLVEAVRKGVLTAEQHEAIMALVRAGARSNGGLAPDLRWIGLLQGALVGGIALYVAAANNDHGWNRPPAEFGAWSALLLAVFLGLALWLRRYRQAEVPAAAAFGGAAAQAFGLGAALCDAVTGRHTHGPSFGGSDLADWARVAGVGAAALVGVLLWWRYRAGPALGVAALAVAVGAEFLCNATRPYDGYLPESTHAWWWGGAGVALLAAGIAQDRLAREGTDGAAWLQLVGAGALGVASVVWIDRSPWALLWALPMALAYGAYGVRAGRRFPLAMAALAVLGLPAFVAMDAWSSAETAGLWLLVSSVLLGVSAQWVRRRLMTAWLDGAQVPTERSLWL